MSQLCSLQKIEPKNLIGVDMCACLLPAVPLKTMLVHLKPRTKCILDFRFNIIKEKQSVSSEDDEKKNN